MIEEKVHELSTYKISATQITGFHIKIGAAADPEHKACDARLLEIE